MGQTTPAIGIYIPSAGETNYDQSWAAGMVNVDQHDHSGGPNKGLPIATEGLGAFSVTFDKLNINVVDPTTGVGTSGVFPNQIVMLDPLKAIFQLAPADGFITMDGTGAHLRTFEDSTTVTWDNPDGTGGNPKAHVNIAGISPVTVPDGGTGLTSLVPYAVLAGGTTSTANAQQVSGLGTIDFVLTSAGPAQLPIWASNFVIPRKPCFGASFTANSPGVTGDGTAYRMNFNNELYDQANNFLTGAAGSSGFTAPYTAIYLFTINLVLITNTSSSAKVLEIDLYVNNAYSAARTPIYTEFDNIVDSSGFLNISATQQLQLNAGDLVYPVMTGTGAGTKSMQVGALTQFTGVILC